MKDGGFHNGYTLTLDNQDLLARVNSIRCRCSLDETAELTITLAASSINAKSLDAAGLSEKATLRVYDRGFFQGTLMDVRRLDGGVTELAYSDATRKLSRITESDFFKGLSLEDYLRRVAAMAGLTAKFHGSFSAMLPAFNVTGTSILDHLQKLAYPYGFYFHARSFSKEIHFTRLDRFVEEQSLMLSDRGKSVASAEARQQGARFYKSGEVRFFDSSTQKSEKKEFSQEQIYEPLGYLKQSKGFQRRAKRAVPAGREERLATQGKQFEESRELLANELSKQAIGQEELLVQAWSLPALPGDKLSVSGMSDGDADGSYLVKSAAVDVTSHKPLVTLTLHRA